MKTNNIHPHQGINKGKQQLLVFQKMKYHNISEIIDGKFFLTILYHEHSLF